MQDLLINSYSGVAVEAIIRGFNGSWQRAIAARLAIDYHFGHSEAECIVQSINEKPGAEKPGAEDFLAAAELIINSKTETNEQSIS